MRLTKVAIMRALGEMETTKEQKLLVWEAQKRFAKHREQDTAGMEFVRTIQKVLGEKKTEELFRRYDKIMTDARKTMAEELSKY